MSTGAFNRLLAESPEAALRDFLRRWHGAELEEAPVAADVPPGLRRIYDVDASAPRCLTVNHLLRPAALEADGDKVLFYAEEQWVVVWGIDRDDLRADDPPVWSREYENGAPWRQDAPSMSVFLVQLAVMNAALTAPHGASAAWLSAEDTDRVLAPLHELALPPWRSAGRRKAASSSSSPCSATSGSTAPCEMTRALACALAARASERRRPRRVPGPSRGGDGGN